MISYVQKSYVLSGSKILKNTFNLYCEYFIYLKGTKLLLWAGNGKNSFFVSQNVKKLSMILWKMSFIIICTDD